MDATLFRPNGGVNFPAKNKETKPVFANPLEPVANFLNFGRRKKKRRACKIIGT
jgi:hypothetical protein